MIKSSALLLLLYSCGLIQLVQNFCHNNRMFLGLYCDDDYGCYQPYEDKITCYNLTEEMNIDQSDEYEEYEHGHSTELVIRNSDIKTLSAHTFSNIVNITKLSMRDVRLTKILPGTFNRHSHLREIYFDGNNLSSIPDGIFNGLHELNTLDLSRNRIENISVEAFQFIKLKKLNLSRNAISGLGSSLMYLRNLTVLDISFNNITIIQNCDSSQVHHNGTTSCIPLNWTIKEIYLRYNKIISIAPLGMNVEVLDVGNNMLSNLSVELFRQSTDLQKLYLNGNGISTIPNSLFSNLTHLTILDLSNNNLSSFSYGTFDGLTEIQTFDVSGNRLKSLPGAFHSLDSLSNLYLQDNDLHDLNLDDLFGGMLNIRTVNLDGNNWNCLKLRNITTQLRRRNVTVLRGFHLEGDNMFGIACHESSTENSGKVNNEAKGEKLEIILDSSKWQQFFNTDFKKSALYRFFVEDFKNTNFIKHFDDFKDDRHGTFQNNVETALDKLDKKIENSSNLFLETIQNITKVLDNGDESFKKVMKTYADELENARSERTDLENMVSSLKNVESRLEKISEMFIDHLNVERPVISNDGACKNFSETLAETMRVAQRSVVQEDNVSRIFTVFFLILMIANVLLISALVYFITFRINIQKSRRDIEFTPVMKDQS